MSSGRKALHAIDSAIKEARERTSLASQAAEAAQATLTDLRRTETSAYSQIADIRLASLGDKEDGLDALGRLDRDATRLIEQHDAHTETLEKARIEAAQALERAEAARREGEEKLELAVEAHEAAAEKTRNRLENDADYQARAQNLEKANAIVDHAASKREVALQDRAQKGKPYEDDPLFHYLWDRQFATSDYRAGPLTTMLDRWVARLIKYRDARLNYERLLDLPERLGEHLNYVESEAEKLALDIEAYERKALEDDGVTALRDKVDGARKDIEAFDQNIRTAEDAYHKSVAALDGAASGQEGPLAQARALLNDAIAERSIPDLKILAAETLTPEDDALVEELAELRLERFALEDEIRNSAKRLKRDQRILSDMEKIRRRFKQARFDSHQSEFKNPNLTGLLMDDLVRGAIDRNEAWRKIERNHRVRRRDWQDDFGGDSWRDGFGLPGSRTPRQGQSGGTNWSRVGRDISREIERELGRSLGRGMGGSLDLDDLVDLGEMLGGGTGNSGRTRTRNRRSTRPYRRRPRRTINRAPRTRTTRRSRPSRSRGGGGFKTGGGF